MTHVQLVVERDLDWIFREQPVEDYGIDAHIELVEGGNVIGRLLAVQIKSGTSWFREATAEGWWFRPATSHVEYWKGHSLPVLVVLYDPDEDASYWQLIDEGTVQQSTSGGWKVLVPQDQRLDATTRDPLRLAAERDRSSSSDQSVHYRSVIASVASRTPTLFGRSHDLAWLADQVHRGAPLVVVDGDPWAGKTALVAKFVTAPPPDCDVVAFFIRESTGDNRSEGCIGALNGQLLDLLQRPDGVASTALGRLEQFRNLVDAAVSRLPQRRLAIVIDALDEQAAEQAPIAAQVGDLPSGVTLIVTSRVVPHPESLGVPIDRLETAARRELHAVAASIARRDEGLALANRLVGSDETAEVDLVSILVVARSGLSVDDLAQLVGVTPVWIRQRLRDFDRHLTNEAPPGRRKRYAPAHVELSRHVLELLGSESAEVYGVRIRVWIDEIRAAGEPLPDFAYDGFVQLLLAMGATDEAVEFLLEADHARSWYAASSWQPLTQQVGITMEALATRGRPGDLVRSVELWLLHERVGAATRAVPIDSVFVLAVLGREETARRIVAGLHDPDQKVRSTLALISASARADPWSAREELLEYRSPYHTPSAYAAVARGLAAHDPEQAFELLETMTSFWTENWSAVNAVEPWCQLSGFLRARSDPRWRRAHARAEQLLSGLDPASTLWPLISIAESLHPDEESAARAALAVVGRRLTDLEDVSTMYSFQAASYLSALAAWDLGEAEIEARRLQAIPGWDQDRLIWRIRSALHYALRGDWSIDERTPPNERLAILVAALEFPTYQDCASQEAILASARVALDDVDSADNTLPYILQQLAERACLQWCTDHLIELARAARWIEVLASLAKRQTDSNPALAMTLAEEALEPHVPERPPALQHLDPWRRAAASHVVPTYENAVALSTATLVEGDAAEVALRVLERSDAQQVDYAQLERLADDRALKALRWRLPFSGERAIRRLVLKDESQVWDVIDKSKNRDAAAVYAGDLVRRMAEIDPERAVELIDICVARFGDLDRASVFWFWGVGGAIETLALSDARLGAELAEKYGYTSDEIEHALTHGQRLNRNKSLDAARDALSRSLASAPDVRLPGLLRDADYDARPVDICSAVARLAPSRPDDARVVLLHMLHRGRGGEVADVLLDVASAIHEEAVSGAVLRFV